MFVYKVTKLTTRRPLHYQPSDTKIGGKIPAIYAGSKKTTISGLGISNMTFGTRKLKKTVYFPRMQRLVVPKFMT